jgi:hypothetical protein
LQLYSHAIPTIQNEAASMIEGLIGDDPAVPSMPAQKAVPLNPDVINL